MKIAIVVQGRFFAFDLANSLSRRGHSVTVLTNYPEFACRRFGLEGVEIRTFPIHGVLSRLANRMSRLLPLTRTEPLLHQLFGRWAARTLGPYTWDCILSFSSVSEELLDAASRRDVRTFLVRGSAHIVEQARLLTEEAERTHATLEIPRKWIIDREQREYEKAGRVVTLSSFAHRSFVKRQFPEHKLTMLPLGVNVAAFGATSQVVQARRDRILLGDEPLRLLYVGNVTYQKGFHDLLSIASDFSLREVSIRCVGEISPEVEPTLATLPRTIDMIGKVAQHELPRQYAWADLFIFPTIHDGFAVVLTQALANGLPVLTTDHCSGPDLIEEGRTGWILPIRTPMAFINRIRWCLSNRHRVAEQLDLIQDSYRARTWDDVALDFETLAMENM